MYFMSIFIWALILLGVISFALFIRRIIIIAQERNNNMKELNTKLDRLIELLEEKTK